MKKEGQTGFKTREEIDALKRTWLCDPIWDIEDTPGFEAYYDELIEYRLSFNEDRERQCNQKVQQRAGELSCSFELANYIEWMEKRIRNLEQRLAEMDR